jgi:hypothetical protein
MNNKSNIGGGGGREGGTPAANTLEESMTRHGKIAGLFRAVRQQLNELLQYVKAAGRLLRWLIALPETVAMLAASFDGQIINEPDLSTWRQGGFRNWKTRQLPLEAMDAAIEATTQLPAASEGWRAKAEVQKSNLIQVNPG